MTTHRGVNYNLKTNVNIFGSTFFSPCHMCVMGKVYFLTKSRFMSKIFCCLMSLLLHLTAHLCQHVWIHYLLLAPPASNLHDVCTTLPWRKRCYILRIVWNYLPGDTASHSKQHVPWKITHWNTLSSVTRPGSPSQFNTQSSARQLRHRCRLLVILAFCQ